MFPSVRPTNIILLSQAGMRCSQDGGERCGNPVGFTVKIRAAGKIAGTLVMQMNCRTGSDPFLRHGLDGIKKSPGR